MATSQDENKKIVKEFFTAVDSKKIDQVKRLLSEDFQLHSPMLSEPWGVKEILEDINKFYKGFPDGRHELYDLVAEDDRVAVRLEFLGTHTGEYEGIPAGGSKVKIGGTHMMSIVDGRIGEWWAVEDVLGFMQQLGFELKPKQ